MRPIITQKPHGFQKSLKKFFPILLIGIISSLQLAAQWDVNCPSKDLQLVDARIGEVNQCVSCDPGATLTKNLILKIYNKTGSKRTSFAFWGYLVQKNASGQQVGDRVLIQGCDDPTKPNGTGILPGDYTEVTFPNILVYKCGNKLEIQDLVMAWTDASAKSLCSTLTPETISPKCGTLPVVPVNAGLNIAGTPTNGICNSSTGLPGKGSIDITITGGVAPYSYQWVGPGTNTSGTGNNPDLSNLNAGLYTLTVTDNNSPDKCTKTATFDIKVAAGVSATSNPTNGTCNTTTGLPGLGSIDITPTPSSPPTGVYSYDWTVSNGGTIPSGQQGQQNLTGLSAGTYAVKISNLDGCFYNATGIAITVAAGVNGSANVINGTCNASGVPGYGSINVTPAPSGSYTYLWTPSNGGAIPSGQQGQKDLTNLGAGTYAVKISTTGGCFKEITGLTVTVKSRPANAVISKVEPTLCGPATGSITVCSPTGGGYQYSKDGGSTWQSNATFTPLAAGSSPSILVKNSDGCWSASPTDCSTASSSCDPPPPAQKSTSQTVTQENARSLGSAELGEVLAVRAMPNPFSNQVRFTIKSATSGMGSLDIYNMQGQKIKTVYSGYIHAGESYFDLKLANGSSSQLMYVLNLNGERVTGKLLRTNQ